MTPLERACRAAHDEHNDDRGARLQALDPNWDGWKSWVPVISAALRAMREPSEGMIDAGLAVAWPGPDAQPYYPDAFTSMDDQYSRAWQAMIDAALKEG